MSATLGQLVKVRSRLVEEVRTYLEALAEETSRLPRYYPKHLRSSDAGKTGFDSIRQMIQVVEDRSAFERWLAEERERLRASGQDVEQLAYDPTRSRPEREVGEDYRGGRRQPAPSPPVTWDHRAGDRFRRAVILGDPGFGKTWLLRYEARRLARTALEGLRNQTIGLDEVIVPISLRLSDVNRRDGPIEEIMVELVGKKRSQNFCRFVRRRFETDRCVILLDAWDEVQPRQELRHRIEAFARDFPRPRILLTSRIVGYDLTLPPLPNAKELELLAFDRRQTESFVSAWFGHDSESAQQFLLTLNQHHQVRGLARIPLVLSLMCRANEEEKLIFPTRRVELYDRCLRGLLRDWITVDGKPNGGRIDAHIRFSDAYVDGILELLNDVALALFKEGYEQFSESLLRKKLLPLLEALKPSHELYGRSAADLINELKEDGLLIAIGEDNEAPLLFLHRTFQEYLAALALAKDSNCIQIAMEHVYDPAWREVLGLLGGTLGDRVDTYVITLLRKNAEDLCYRPARIAVSAAMETSENQLPPALLEMVLKWVLSIYFDPPAWLSEIQVAALAKPLNEVAIPFIVQRLTDKHFRVSKEAAAWLLGKIGSTKGFSYLVCMLSDKFSTVRRNAVTALGRIGSSEAIPYLIQKLNDQDRYVRAAAVQALGRIGSAKALPNLARCLADKDTWIRQQTASALGHIRSTEGVTHLLSALNDEDFSVRQNAVKALSKIGSTKAIPHLIQRLADRDIRVRFEVVATLVGMDSPEIETCLTRSLENEDVLARMLAAQTLAEIGYSQGMDYLLQNLESEDADVRGRAVQTIGRICHAMDVRPIIRLLDDEDTNVRSLAAEALGRLRSAESVPVLVKHWINEEVEDVHIRTDCMRAIAQINPRAAMPYLMRGLEDKDIAMRCCAAHTLGKIGAVQAVPHLLRQMSDQDERVRREVLAALVNIGSTEAVPYLVPQLVDKSVDVRLEAVRALGKIASPKAVTNLVRVVEHDHVARAAAYFLGRIASVDAVPVLSRIVMRTQATALEEIGRRHKVPISVAQAPESVRKWADSLAQSLEELAKIADKANDKEE